MPNMPLDSTQEGQIISIKFTRSFCGNSSQEDLGIIPFANKTPLTTNVRRMRWRLQAVRTLTYHYLRPIRQITGNLDDKHDGISQVLDRTQFGQIESCSIKHVAGIFCVSSDNSFTLAERFNLWGLLFSYNQRLQHELAHVQQEQCSGAAELEATGGLCKADLIVMELIAIAFGSFWGCVRIAIFAFCVYAVMMFCVLKFTGVVIRLDDVMVCSIKGLVYLLIGITLLFVANCGHFFLFHGRPCRFSSNF